MPVDRTTLTARIQDILRTGSRRGERLPPAPALPVDEERVFAERCAEAEARASVLEVLGGRLAEGARGPSVVVDRLFDPEFRHGRVRVADLAEEAGGAVAALELLAAGRPGGPRSLLEPARDWRLQDLLFFDLETTGLSGGAGTYAFLVGFGRFDADGRFRTRQLFLRSYGEERALLDAVAAFVEEHAMAAARGADGALPEPVLVTYNGRTFDVPLMETRFVMHRLRSPFDRLRHLDMLHPARRLWRLRESSARPLAGEDEPWSRPAARSSPRRLEDLAASCALTMLEQDVLGFRREDDVPGFEIPARYFHFARTGDARGLAAVLEHNRLDLLSLAGVTAVALRTVNAGSAGTRAPCECLAVGRLYEQAGRLDEAAACYRRVADGEVTAGRERDAWVRVEGLRRLAFRLHRARQHAEAAGTWERLLALGLGGAVEQEACQALAVYHEHRSRDLEWARRYATLALTRETDPRARGALRHRLDRIGRKLGRTGQ